MSITGYGTVNCSPFSLSLLLAYVCHCSMVNSLLLLLMQLPNSVLILDIWNLLHMLLCNQSPHAFFYNRDFYNEST